MLYPSLKEFLSLTKKGNVIPVYKEINADLDTPVSAFLKLKKGDYAFLLESVEGQEKIARYSFLGADPHMVFKSKSKKIELIYPQEGKRKSFTSQDNSFDELKKIMRDFRSVELGGLPRFYGGLVGYIGYDTVRFFEKLPDKNKEPFRAADIHMLLTDTVLIFDHFKHTIKIVSNVLLPAGASLARKKSLYRKAVRKIELIHKDCSRPLPPGSLAQAADKKKGLRVKSNVTKEDFMKMVRQAKEYIRRGDIIQVVLSQRLTVQTAAEPFRIYRNLRNLNPSPYMYFFKLKDLFIIGSSPEMLVRSENGKVETRPIAGTKPRGKNAREDSLLEQELLHDEKERAEHLMLVDLGRNDLGRVSLPGKVEVGDFMRVEKYSHVMHLVSEVRAVLDKKRFDVYDVLKAAFPAGTVSGAPKIRAMEIIDELENSRRSIYSGAVGYFSFSHNMDTCITIRTVVLKAGYAYIQAGAGIVADSVPEKEYRETLNKARALMEAIRA